MKSFLRWRQACVHFHSCGWGSPWPAALEATKPQAPELQKGLHDPYLTKIYLMLSLARHTACTIEITSNLEKERHKPMTMGLDNFYQRMLERIRQLRRERTEHEEILAFFNKVLAAQREAQKETTVPEIDLTAGQVKLKVDEGFPLMERENFPVDKGGSRELFQQICQLSLEENPVLAAAGQGLLEAMDAGKLDFNRLTAAVLRSDSELVESSARKLGLEYPILQALVKLSLQPSLLETAAAVAERVALDGWRYGYCPICGAPPAVAALVGEEGGRQAVCSFCGHFWRLPRVACPFCNNEKQERLRYFYGEGEDLCRIQVCEECRGYLKVIDTRDGGDSMAISVDDIATTHLDLLAEGEGYQRRAPRLWGI